ncbi:MAG: FtsX-like permease family protein [Nitrososphaerota archaeon]|nr:FtsX-like permease family protein [Nitrososphaerota archaeon]
MISVQAQINIQTDLNLANLSRKIDEINLPKEVLKTTIDKWQEDLIFELCGPLYLHNPKRRYNRAGSTKRTLKTRHGTIAFRLIRVHDQKTGHYFNPLLTDMGLLPKQRIVGQFMLEGVLLSVGAAVIAILLSTFVLAPLASLILPVPVQESVFLMWDANGTMQLGNSGFLPGEAPMVIGASLGVEWLVLSFGLAVLLGGLGSLYPAWRAARTRPAEAMRSD